MKFFQFLFVCVVFGFCGRIGWVVCGAAFTGACVLLGRLGWDPRLRGNAGP